MITASETQVKTQLGFQEASGAADEECTRAPARHASLNTVTERVRARFAGWIVEALDFLAATPAPPSLAEIWRYADQGAYAPPGAVWARRLGRLWGRGAVAWCSIWYAAAVTVQTPLWAKRVPELWKARNSATGLGLYRARPVSLIGLIETASGLTTVTVADTNGRETAAPDTARPAVADVNDRSRPAARPARLLLAATVGLATGLCYLAAWTGQRFLNAAWTVAWTATVAGSLAAIAASL